jgi:YesN/AraC family two-component response regulator
LAMLPFQHGASRRALEAFVTAASQFQLAPTEWDAILLPFLSTIDRHARRLPTCVERFCYQIHAHSETDRLTQFAHCVDDVLRYRGVGDPIVQEVIQAIEERYMDLTFSLTLIAQREERRPAQLAVAFLRETGLTVMEYLRGVRLDHAARLLACADRSIKEVWAGVGYNDASNFHHDFKRRFGIPPREYRAKMIRPWSVEMPAYLQTKSLGRPDRASPADGTVLIVDDDESTRATILQWLSLEGYRPSCASTAIECLREVEESPPDVILLDYRLPDMTGMECLRKLRRRYPGPSLQVALFTADLDVYDEESDIRALSAVIASKLCDLETLGDLVASLAALVASN